MSGTNVPYHLRPNKFVERQLFLELIDRLGHVYQLKDYAYVSLGGRFLEDFKLVHARFGLRRLYSLESDRVTHERQVFNRPLAIIECLNESTTDFILRFDQLAASEDIGKFIIWLDYTSPRQRQEQLQDFQTLVSKLADGDVVKITLNASVHTLDRGQSEHEAHRRDRLNTLRQTLGDYFPPGAWHERHMSARGIAVLLANSAKKAALEAIEGSSGLTVLPLAVFRYNDAFHQMLTVTTIVVKEAAKDEFLDNSGLREWDFLSSSWDEVHEIAVPDLSLKERLTIDEGLFLDSLEKLHEKLGFKLHPNNNKSLDSLRQYHRHYRRFPSFVRAFT